MPENLELFPSIAYNRAMIICGIDFGDARTGIARVNTALPIVTPLPTIRDRSLDGTAEKAARILKEQAAQLVVVGLPRNMDGSEGFRAEKVRLFGEKLKDLTGIPVEYYDERLTSTYAHHIMDQTETFGKKRKNQVDAIAATLILQSYVDAKKQKEDL